MNTNINSDTKNKNGADSKTRSNDLLMARGQYWAPDRPAVLEVRSRAHHARTNMPLKRPVVLGTLYLGDWRVTVADPFALGALACMAQADSISYLPPYVDWDVVVEEVFDEELRTMLEPEDAAFVARVRDGFLSQMNSGRGSKRSAK